ncbi:MAG: XRE family transcriptional regulator [Mycobacteriales bacterium]
MGDPVRDDGKPAWARRIHAERTARGWSQAKAVLAMQAHADRPLSTESLLRNWKRWESGKVEPDDFHKPLIAKTFGTVTAAIFPRPSRRDEELMAGIGMDTLEIITRLRASDVSSATIDALQVTAERLGCEYSREPPDQLYREGQAWLRRLVALLDQRLSLTQHREMLVIAGQIALLVGCLEYDMGLHQPAEVTRRAALSLGVEADAADIVGWAHEMRAWYALTQGQYRGAIAATEAGLEAVGPHRGVAVQLLAHRAKAWARLGDRRQVEIALDRGRMLLEALPYPDNVDNHLVVDPEKWDFYTMDAYRHVGEDQLAATYAREVIRTSTDLDGTERKPMRTAEARITLGVIAAREGDLERAVAYGRQALAGDRQSRPSLLMVSRELGTELAERYAGHPEAAAYLDELRDRGSSASW